MIEQPECYHQSTQYYNEFENELTGEIIEEDFEVCRDCTMVLFQGEEMGLMTKLHSSKGYMWFFDCAKWKKIKQIGKGSMEFYPND